MTDATAVPEESPIGILAQRRQQLVDEALLTLAVQRWSNPKIYVTYRPVEPKELRKTIATAEEAFEQDRDDEADDAAAALLAKHCVKIEAREFQDGHADVTWKGFGPELGDALGVTERRAATVCRKLFCFGGDLNQHLGELNRWSARKVQAVDKQISGE